jgi:signal transduction histidine kinase
MFILSSNFRVGFGKWIIIGILSVLGPVFDGLIQASIENSHKQQLIDYVCRVAEPRLQAGAFREVQDYLISSTRFFGEYTPLISLSENGRNYKSAEADPELTKVFRCVFSGRSDVEVSFAFRPFKPSLSRILFDYSVTFFIMLAAFGLLQKTISAQSEQLAQRRFDSAVAQMAAQIAHDIRSPLSAINIAVSNFKELPPDRRKLIADAVTRINDIANDLLVRRKDLQKDLRGSNNNLTEIFPVLESLAEEKKLELSKKHGLEILTDFESVKSLSVRGDRSQIARAISNLINNSAEAINDTGKIKIVAGRIADKIKISIVDSGKGISPEDLAVLQQRSRSIGKNSSDSGFGIGLVQVRSAMENMGGEFELSSEVGLGTTATLTLPIQR